MSVNLKIPCNENLKEIGIFNRIQALYIPVGVTVNVSFLETPKDDELFPLTRLVSDKNSSGEMVAEARRCFLHITGTSAEDMILICSNVTPDGGYIDVEELEELALEASTKSVIEGLDKIINPYQAPVNTSASDTNTTLTTILSKTLASDKIKIILNVASLTADGFSQIYVKVDGIIVGVASMQRTGTYDSFYFDNNVVIELDNINGSLLEIASETYDATKPNNYILQEFTLKP